MTETKKYVRLIKPVLSYPSQYYETVFEDLETPERWYPEEDGESLYEKYKYKESAWEHISFKEKFVPIE